MRDILPRRLWLVIVAPLEIIGCAAIYAGRGAKMGWQNIKEDWHSSARQ